MFNKGLNVTVRRGDTWMKANVGDSLLLKKLGENPILAIGMVLAKAYLSFWMIPEEWLKYQHDPEARTRKGLYAEMLKTYPDFKAYEWVTILIFSV